MISRFRRFLQCLACAAGLLGIALPGCQAQQPWPLWQAYCAHNLDAQGRVIDHSAADRTTSEGQSYALFFSLVDNDRPRFDRLLAWTVQNLAAGDLSTHLPAWEWGRQPSGQWTVLDANSASDSDLWIAYTLLEAGRLWHEPRFAALGRQLALLIAAREVVTLPQFGTVLVAGAEGFGLTSTAGQSRLSGAPVIVNPSYTPAPLLLRLAHTFPAGPWGQIAASLPGLTGGTPSHGFAMDWLALVDGKPTPIAWPPQGPAGRPAVGSYDAIRVYLWLGLADPATPGSAQVAARLGGMQALLQAGSSPPSVVDAAGKVLNPEAPPGFLAAVIPYLEHVGLPAQAGALRGRLAATRDPVSGLYGPRGDYYDQNLTLFSTGWSEGRFHFERDGTLHVAWR